MEKDGAYYDVQRDAFGSYQDAETLFQVKLPYLSHKAYMLSHYGEALFSIPVNLEFGCPNREHDGTGGCTFCPEHGARAAQIADASDVEEQIQHALSFAKRRYKAKRFALYIQAYTGTFTSLRTQKQTYEKLLRLYAFDALYIGTRPDCLSDATIEYLSELSQTCEVVIELGVQSLHDASLAWMKRGHDAACSLNAIARLRSKGLRVHVHLILGLKGETPLHWRQSVEGVVRLDIQGIKFHNLHVIHNTELAREYTREPFALLDAYTYAEALMEVLRYVPSSIPILRLSTDTPKKALIAPLWQMSKGNFVEYIAKTMRYRCIQQGDKVENLPPKNNEIHNIINLKDGSTTFWNKTYRDYYHPKAGALTQAKILFIQQSKLEKRLKKNDVALLDIGFGMGYNTMCALNVAQNLAQKRLHVKTIDHDKMLLIQSAQVISDALHVKLLESLFASSFYEKSHVKVESLFLEARYALSTLKEQFDIIFLDPFLESNNASLVSVEFFQMLRSVLKQNGVLVASTSLHAVHDGLCLAGFDVRVVDGLGCDIKGVVATPTQSTTVLHVKNPYRDPHLVWSDKEIESAHQKRSLV